MFRCAVVHLDLIGLAQHFAAFSVDNCAHYPWDICNGTRAGLELLHLVYLYPEVVGLENGIHELLFCFTFQSDRNLLVHKKVRHVFTDLLRHSGGVSLALHSILSVEHVISVEVLDVTVIPGLPLLHLSIKRCGNSIEPTFS